ncbi:MAG: hypothetical protein ACPGLV_12600 [Bacteroidia bacterium]
MSDNLEKFVKQNREAFDSEVPSDLVWKSIQNEVKPIKKPSKVIKINSRFMWAAAAMLIFAFSVILYQGGVIRDLKGNSGLAIETNNTIETEWKMPPQLQDMNQAYVQQVGITMDLLKRFPTEQEELKEELTELDNEFEVLKSELGTEIASEDVLHAMIENYRIKLELLEITLEYFKRSEKIVEDEELTL